MDASLSPIARAVLDELGPVLERMVEERVQARGNSAPGPGPRPVLLTAQAVADACGSRPERVRGWWATGAVPFVSLGVPAAGSRVRDTRRLLASWLPGIEIVGAAWALPEHLEHMLQGDTEGRAA